MEHDGAIAAHVLRLVAQHIDDIGGAHGDAVFCEEFQQLKHPRGGFHI